MEKYGTENMMVDERDWSMMKSRFPLQWFVLTPGLFICRGLSGEAPARHFFACGSHDWQTDISKAKMTLLRDTQRGV